MKKVIKSLCYLSLVMGLMFVTSCSDDDEQKTVFADFNGKLTEKESIYLSNEENGELMPNEYGVVYKSTFTDNTKAFGFDSYSAKWNGTDAFQLSCGFTYTNLTDTETPNSNAAITAKGVYSNTYLTCFVGYDDFSAKLTNGTSTLKGCFITNTVYAYTAMKEGYGAARPFTKEDTFKLIFIGYKKGAQTGTVEFYLAKDGKILNTWTWVNLEALGEVDELKFNMETTDVGQYGGNTPTYFCMDALTLNL